MSIIGIDFETANAEADSACQIGLVLVEQGRVVDRFASLIRPSGDFSPYCIAVHGITASQVHAAPTIAALWPRVREFMARGRRIVAHNAAFDHRVLVASLVRHGVDDDIGPFECTLSLARARLPELPNHRLPTVCAALGITLTTHHDALADANATAFIAWHLGEAGAVATRGP